MAVLGVTVAQVIMGEDHPVQALDAKTIHVCISSVLDARIPQYQLLYPCPGYGSTGTLWHCGSDHLRDLMWFMRVFLGTQF
jgi:hypothetical protein